MSLEQLANLAQIVASLAVVASLVYLARQLSQSNELSRTEARLGLMRNRIDMLNKWVADEDTMQLRLKAHNGEELTQDERWRLESDFASILVTFEWEHEQYLHGRVFYLPINGYRGVLQRWPYLKSMWPMYRNRFSPEFARFMEEELLDSDQVEN
jgi:hypothetical protein